jgi:hypothetical protein
MGGWECRPLRVRKSKNKALPYRFKKAFFGSFLGACKKEHPFIIVSI